MQTPRGVLDCFKDGVCLLFKCLNTALNCLADTTAQRKRQGKRLACRSLRSGPSSERPCAAVGNTLKGSTAPVPHMVGGMRE